MFEDLELYDPSSLALIPWPSSADGHYAQKVLTPLLLEGSQHFVQNANTQLFVLLCGEIVLPVTVNRSERGNSYVCSPFAHYVSYAKEELYELKNPVLERVLAPVLEGLGAVLKAGQIDRVLHVGNWLLSTNLYPQLSREHIERITRFLAQKFPDCAVVWRSVVEVPLEGITSPVSPQHFSTDFKLIPSRSVLFLNARAGTHGRKKDFKHDLKLLRSSPYQLRPARAEDLGRIRDLYNLLYLDKYSRLNPQFTPAFFELAFKTQMLELFVLEQEGRVDGVLGFFSRGELMTCPVLGYDTSLPVEAGLYRILSAHLVLIAQKRGLILHASSGVAAFKRSRGAVPALEVNAVFDAHLPLYRRVVWTLLEWTVKRAWRMLERRGL